MSDGVGTPAQAMGRVAVVLVHGMGEQRPMRDLREFVDAYVRADPGVVETVYATPDRCNNSFELHSIVVVREQPAGGVRQVDFYQGYWAPDMSGTTPSAVLAWSRGLIMRAPWRVPRRLLPVYVVIWATLIAAAWFIWHVWASGAMSAAWMKIVGTVAGLVVPMLASALATSIGDVARYVDNRPGNVAARTAVRRDVVELLERLHESGRYDRIIVVGHSLGGIVAYDAVSILWARRVSGNNISPAKSRFRNAYDLQGLVATLEEGHRDELRAGQAALFRELSWGRDPLWLISDLVTVGSPVAYPELFLVPRGYSVSDAINERAVATCPPELATAVTHPGGRDGESKTYCYPSQPTRTRDDTALVFHHAAVFAATRWTNVYASGDFVGRRASDVLGWGIKDERWDASTSPWSLVPVASHSRYWSTPEGRRRMRHILDEAAGAVSTVVAHSEAESQQHVGSHLSEPTRAGSPSATDSA